MQGSQTYLEENFKVTCEIISQYGVNIDHSWHLSMTHFLHQLLHSALL